MTVRAEALKANQKGERLLQGFGVSKGRGRDDGICWEMESISL